MGGCDWELDDIRPLTAAGRIGGRYDTGMFGKVAITFAVIVLVAALISLAIRWDVLLFILRPKFSLRTLLIVLVLGPPVLWIGWGKYEAWKAEQDRQAALAKQKAAVPLRYPIPRLRVSQAKSIPVLPPNSTSPAASK
jgi:hypothetical protein